MGKKKAKKIQKEAEILGFKDLQKYTFYGKRKGAAIIKTDTKKRAFSHNMPKFLIKTHLDLKKIEKKFKISSDEVITSWNQFLT